MDPDLSDYILQQVRLLAPDLKLVEVPSNWRPTFTAQTICGPLTITPLDNFIACRFEDVEKAKAHFGVRDYDVGAKRLNPFSGKWNWHWFEGAAYKTRPSKAHVKAGIDAVLKTLTAEVEAILAPNA